MIQKIFLSLSLFLACVACAKQPDYPAAPSYFKHPSGRFPITASYALNHPFMTDRQMQWVKEAGFNNITKVLSYDDTDSLIRLATKHDLTVLVANWDMRDTLNTVKGVARYKEKPQVWGFTAYDEPVASQFPYMATLENKMLTTAPDKTRFFNLLPAMNPKDLGAKSYRDYVEEFVKDVNPPFLSLDIYPIKKDKDGNIYVDPVFYSSMETIRDVSLESDRPFWSYILANKHWMYPKPSREYLRFAVFSSLAYGAQGLIYFTYLLPDFDAKGEFTDAPIDKEGRRTDVWYMVRDINNEVRNLEKVFLDAEVVDVSQTGPSIPLNTKRLDVLPAPFRILESDGVGLTVSHLRNEGNEYLLIVNRDVENKQNVYLSHTEPVTRLHGNGKETRFNGNRFSLAPGGYALFRM